MSTPSGFPYNAQTLGSSKVPMRTYLAALKAAIAQDHISTDDTGSGKHTVIHEVAQAADGTTAVGEIARYSKLVSGITQDFMRRENNGAIIQLTANIVPSAGSNGITFLAGGIILQWGIFSTGAAITVNAFPTAFPTNCYGVWTSANSGDPDNFLGITAMTPTQFTAKRTNASGSITYTYIAVGN